MDTHSKKVGEAADQVKAAVSDFGRKTVDTLDATADMLEDSADYVRAHDVKTMAEDVTALVRRYPGTALALAGAAGFLVARLLSSRD